MGGGTMTMQAGLNVVVQTLPAKLKSFRSIEVRQVTHPPISGL